MLHLSLVYVDLAQKFGSRGSLAATVLALMHGTWRAGHLMPSPI